MWEIEDGSYDLIYWCYGVSHQFNGMEHLLCLLLGLIGEGGCALEFLDFNRSYGKENLKEIFQT